MKLIVGNKVKWTIGSVETKGVFLEYTENDEAKIITHYIADRVDNREITLECPEILEPWK